MQFNSKQNNTKVGSAYDLERKYNLSSLNELPSMKKAIEVNSIGLTKTNQELENFVRETLGSIENLQDQIDGNIMTWFYPNEPTLENAPANEWETEKDKINHLGDLYYDSSTGYAYRWTLEDSVFSWIKLSDSDVAEALSVANAAKDTADHKRTTFITEPYVPYQVGDIWFITTGEHEGEMWRCKRSKDETGTFEIQDWIVATKYTDDSFALSIKEDLDNFVGVVVRDYITRTVLEETERGLSAEVSKVEVKADSKARVFKSQPTTPYSVGDIYINNSNMYTCITEKEDGDFDDSDWELNLNGDDYASKSSLEIESDRITAVVEEVTELSLETISSVDVLYALGNSSTTAPTSGWSTTAPAWEDGKYMWQKTKVTYADNHIVYSDSTCISGASGSTGPQGPAGPQGNQGPKGDTGATGKGISSIKEQYYLSSSNESCTGGTWQDTCPSWEMNKYIWTRSYIVWSDGTTSTTTEVLANALNDANSNAQNANDSIVNISDNVSGLNNNYSVVLSQIAQLVENANNIQINIENTTTLLNKINNNYATQDDLNNVVVNEVTTTTGYKFDKDGLNISKTGAPTSSLINEAGMSIKNSSNQEVFFAGYDSTLSDSVVKTNRMIMNNKCRFEDYTDQAGNQAIGCFWL